MAGTEVGVLVLLGMLAAYICVSVRILFPGPASWEHMLARELGPLDPDQVPDQTLPLSLPFLSHSDFQVDKTSKHCNVKV